MSFLPRSRSSHPPVTLALIIGIAGCFVISWFGQQGPLHDFFLKTLGFYPYLASDQLWTLITYPFSTFGDGNSFIFVLFICLWLWGLGGTVERDLKPLRYALLFFIVTVLASLCFWFGSVVTFLSRSEQARLIGAWVPVVGITVAWATRNPRLEILFMFVVKLQARWVAWISVAMVFFSTDHPVLALFAMIPLALVYFYAADKLPIAYGPGRRGSDRWSGRETRLTKKEQKEYYEDVRRREQQREERERLRKLFENSLIEDPDDEKDK
jgi:membrane associated rhomboid family serine protease